LDWKCGGISCNVLVTTYEDAGSVRGEEGIGECSPVISEKGIELELLGSKELPGANEKRSVLMVSVVEFNMEVVSILVDLFVNLV
jgi:hypothetical protein